MESEMRAKRNGEMDMHYFVPAFFDLENLACKVEISDNEKIEVHCGEEWEKTKNGMEFRDYLNVHVAEAITKKFEQKPVHFIRCTNNKEEVQLAKSGELRPSKNHRDNINEIGVSVADDYGYVANGAYEYAYFVDGEVIGIGSDGEPLLNPKSIKVAGRMIKREKMIQNHMKKMIEERNANLSSCGWSEDAFIKLSVSILCGFSYKMN